MTAEDQECRHGIDARDCSMCRRTTPSLHGPSRPVRQAMPLVIAARFEGQCIGCDLGIHVGQAIQSNGTAYVHEGCA